MDFFLFQNMSFSFKKISNSINLKKHYRFILLPALEKWPWSYYETDLDHYCCFAYPEKNFSIHLIKQSNF